MTTKLFKIVVAVPSGLLVVRQEHIVTEDTLNYLANRLAQLPDGGHRDIRPFVIASATPLKVASFDDVLDEIGALREVLRVIKPLVTSHLCSASQDQ